MIIALGHVTQLDLVSMEGRMNCAHSSGDSVLNFKVHSTLLPKVKKAFVDGSEVIAVVSGKGWLELVKATKDIDTKVGYL